MKNKEHYTIVGPFRQLLTMSNLPRKGPIDDVQMIIIKEAGIVIHKHKIQSVRKFADCVKEYKNYNPDIIEFHDDYVGLPGIIDAHTHICFDGSRARDFAMRNTGKSYLEIAKEGGGIWDTVQKTRNASAGELQNLTVLRAEQLLKNGITTIEVKSGYGLSVEEELKMLRAINDANQNCKADLIPTCLAAHIFPKDYNGNIEEYIIEISNILFPIIQKEGLANRVDVFIEDEAFHKNNIPPYFEKAIDLGFDITIHADQFSPGGSELAVQYSAISADHLEASSTNEIEILAKSEVIATALPGASIGLGVQFAPCRKILDAGCSLCIASDWNPGSAPMGDLLTQASILAPYEKLSTAEVFAGITYRAANALNLPDRGQLKKDQIADIIAFPCNDYREILYQQGSLKPGIVWKNGESIQL